MEKNDIIKVPNEKLGEIAFQAYIYGLSILEMEVSRYFMTHAQFEGDTEWSNPGEFQHNRQFATPETTKLRAPNVDVLYSNCWVNLEKEPIVIHVPDTNDRYYSIQVNDMFSNIIDYVGRRTTGTKEEVFALVGPNHSEDVIEVKKTIHVPTNECWLLLRTFSSGGNDLKATHAIQDKMKLTSYSKFKEKNYMAFQEEFHQDYQVMLTESEVPYGEIEFYQMLNKVLRVIQMPESEKDLKNQFNSILIGPDTTFNINSFTVEQIEILKQSAKKGEDMINQILNSPKSDVVNGWSGSSEIGKFKSNYYLRALCARGGIGGNIAEEAYYPTSYYTDDNERYNGSNEYVMKFNKDEMPPVNAFWSLTVYDSATHSLIDNPIDRYAIRDIDDDLTHNEDGSLTIYIQSEPPLESDVNWLPVKKGREFHLIFRAYQPKEAWFNGSYKLPAVKRKR